MVVLGLGGVGSAAAYHLAKAGQRVLGLDQYAPPHQRGSSHGETRIIRKAYFEHADYVPLLCRAYELWHELEQEQETKLFHRTGLIEIGPADGVIIPGIQKSAAQFNLPIETMTMRQASHRYPCIDGDESWQVILEKDAGYLRVEACVESHLNLALACGADLRMNQQVTDWQPKGDGVIVHTADASFTADRLVLAAGPWAGQWLRRYGLPLTVLRKHLYWYRIESPAYQETRGFPCFFFETPSGCFYGFPQRDALGLKVARHSGGEIASTAIDGVHSRDEQDQRTVEDFLGAHLPQVSLQMTRTEGCYYTMSPDENFVLDTLPDYPQVTIVAGLSGHGFKFTSVLGEIAAKLSTDVEIEFNLEFLKLSRFIKPSQSSAP